MDWYEAVDYCESNFDDSYLADILDQETQEFIEDSDILQSYPLVSYWIGGSDTETVSHKKITGLYRRIDDKTRLLIHIIESRVLTRLLQLHPTPFIDCLWRGFLMLMYC